MNGLSPCSRANRSNCVLASGYFPPRTDSPPPAATPAPPRGSLDSQPPPSNRPRQIPAPLAHQSFAAPLRWTRLRRFYRHVAVLLKTIDYHFPLYLYPASDRHDRSRTSNPRNVSRISTSRWFAPMVAAHGSEPTPEDIFNYVYAVLYAPVYRAKYAEFLRMDFPRIPFTADSEVFRVTGGAGRAAGRPASAQIRPNSIASARFEGAGDGLVAKSKGVRYDAEASECYINAAQYFAPVPLRSGPTRSAATRCATSGSKTGRSAGCRSTRSAPTAASSPRSAARSISRTRLMRSIRRPRRKRSHGRMDETKPLQQRMRF